MVNGGTTSYSLNGWHGMYAISGIKADNDRIYKDDEGLNLLMSHAVQAAEQLISDRRQLNYSWRAN